MTESIDPRRSSSCRALHDWLRYDVCLPQAALHQDQGAVEDVADPKRARLLEAEGASLARLPSTKTGDPL